MTRRRAIPACLGAVLIAAGASAPRAAASDPFSALLGKGQTAAAEPEVARYEVAGDGRAFLLEGRIGAARIKYLCGDGDPRVDCVLDPVGRAEEIFLATGVRGSRGEVTFRDDGDRELLRVTPFGGATVFWPGRPQGDAASQTVGEGGPLVLPYADHQDAVRRAARATSRLSAMTGATILFDPGAAARPAARVAAASAPSAAALRADAPAPAGEARSADEGAPASPEARVLADAIVRAAAGMDKVAGDPTGARVLAARIGVVRFRPGAPPGLALDGRVLTIVYDPLTDVAGRPSSRAVAQFLEQSL